MLANESAAATLAVKDLARAKKFYAETLGLRLASEDSFALVFDAGGTMLRVVNVAKVHPAGYTVLAWIVADIAATVAKLQQRGIRIHRYAGMEQDADGVWTSPSGARIAWFDDPDGNTLSVTQLAKPGLKRRKKSG